MERQLKERLIGAGVLVAAAVILVPEMFSGPREPVASETTLAWPAASQIKTYSVQLQSSPTAGGAATPVEPPAARPLDEEPSSPVSPDAPQAAVPTGPEPQPQAMTTSSPSRETAVAVRPATPEAVKPAGASVADKKASGDGWLVQVGSFSTRDRAQQIAAQLKGQGFAAFVEPVEVSGRTLYRVRIGTMADRAGAEATRQKLHGSFPGASIVAPGH